MNPQTQLDSDLKAAMLASDKVKTETLKGLKNALQYEAVAQQTTPDQLSEEQVQSIFRKEAKKRTEAIELYSQANELERSQKESAEKAIIEGYLPKQASEEEIKAAVADELAKIENPTPANMGQIIGAVRTKLGPSTDGATTARLIKEALEKK